MNTQPERQLRRHFSGTEKVAILKRHLLEKVPISNLCDELHLYPNQVRAWLKEFFENGHVLAGSEQPVPDPWTGPRGRVEVRGFEALEALIHGSAGRSDSFHFVSLVSNRACVV